MAGEVVFERRRPIDFRVLTAVTGIATMAVAGGALLGSRLELGVVSAIVGGVLTMVCGQLVAGRAAYGGLLFRLPSALTLVRPMREDYRSAAPGPHLAWGGVQRPVRSARELVIGHFINDGGGHPIHFWPLFLVFDDCVVELDVYRDHDEALAARAALAERFELPTREIGAGRFGADNPTGWLAAGLTVAGQLATVLIGSLGGLFVGGSSSLHALLPTVMVLLLWASTFVTSRVGREQARLAVDEKVRETFELDRPRVRVATEPDEAPELEVAEGEEARTAEADR